MRVHSREGNSSWPPRTWDDSYQPRERWKTFRKVGDLRFQSRESHGWRIGPQDKRQAKNSGMKLICRYLRLKARQSMAH